MRTVRTVEDVRAAVRAAEGPVGLVPTMGALHEGHLALIRAARQQTQTVVVSLFVNPAQFTEAADLDGYPRDEARDAALAQEAGADLLFAPPVEAVYPPGFATTVAVAGVSEPMEGAQRGASHFDGVATVVTKLLNMVGPDVAYFGQKDAQQLVVIRRLVRDLDLPVRIEAVPTVREPDGLALSQALRAAEDAAAAGERDPAAVRAEALGALNHFGVEPEYLELVSPETLTPVDTVDGDVLVAVAARIGTTRLIDNTLIRTNGRHPR